MRLAFALVLATGTAHAGGQMAGDNGSLAAQRAGAFTARADDPSALVHNPGALAGLVGRQVFLGVNVVAYDQSFQREGSYGGNDGQIAYAGDPYPVVEHDGPVQPVPFVAAAYGGPTYAFAVGVFAPHGYGKRNYPDTVQTASGSTAPAPQRYDTVTQDALIALPSLAVAVPLSDSIRIGGRVSYGFARMTSRRFAQGLPGEEDPGTDTDASIAVADDAIVAWGAGVHVRASDQVELGVSYASPITINARGTASPVLGEDLRNLMPGTETRIVPVDDAEARCAPGGQEGALMTCLDMALPQTASAGVRYIARDAAGREIGDLELDVRWENWAAVDRYDVLMDGKNSALDTPVNPTVVRHGFQDVYSARVGGSRRLGSELQYMVSLGLGYETAAAPVSWTRLDVDTAERIIAGGGVAVDLGSWRLDLGVEYIDPHDRRVYDQPVADPSDMSERVQPDVSVPLEDPESQPYHPFNAGTYASQYLIGSAGLTATW